jgi:putative ABC transport system permease protein
VLGRAIRLDGRDYTIVGVMPAGFQYLFERTDVLTPLSVAGPQRARGWRGFRALGRLKPGVTVAAAAAEVGAISARVEKEDPKAGLGWRGTVRPLADEVMGGEARIAAGAMLGATGLVLLIACANVASLLLARCAHRGRELAIRASLGAGRGSLVGLQLAESLLLAVFGGALGVLSALWTIPLLKRIAPPEMELLQMAALDWPTLLFGLALTLATGLVFGAIPAWQSTAGDLSRALQEAGRGSSGGRHVALKAMVAGEVALALVLAAATTLMTRSLARQASRDPGFDRTNLLAANVLLGASRYPTDERVRAFYDAVLDSLRRDGSLESAAMVQTLPLAGNNSYSQVTVDGGAGDRRDNVAGFMVVSPGYFRTLKIPLAAGRDFSGEDTATSPPVAIVNEAFVRRYWPGVENPVGRRLRTGGEKAPWITVVGMARDVRHTSLTDPPRPEFYRPHAQSPARTMILVVRAKGGAANAAEALRAAVRQADPEQPLYRMEPVETILASRMGGGRATTQVLGFLAAVALILAAVGTYGVMAYLSSRRLRELGIRMALGATASHVFGMMLRGGMLRAAAGLAAGLAAAYAAAPVLRSIGAGLEDVNPRELTSYLSVASLLLVVAVVACAVPAWRATRIDPASVLREE